MSEHDDFLLENLTIPDTLPVLSRGNHRPGSATPCVMEAASWLAKEPWSDHPRSVHPAIAGVARLVNDHVSDEDRQQLWSLVLSSLDTARPLHPILNFRLRRFALHAAARESHPGRELWERVLDRFSELSGCDLHTVSAAKAAALRARLDAPFAGDRKPRSVS